MPTLHATVTAYKGILVLELLAKASIAGQVHSSLDNPDAFGQVIMNTAEHLGVSAEALALLEQIRPGHDSLGDIDWFASADGQDTFGWIGGPYALQNPAEAEASRQYRVGKHVVVPNTPAEGACQAIDNMLASR